MPNPWDQPPFPKRGNSERILFQAIGRALMAWEEVEGAFAHLYSTFLTGWPFVETANRQYGEPLNFVHRAQGLQQTACSVLSQRNPSQDREGTFDGVLCGSAIGWSGQKKRCSARSRSIYLLGARAQFLMRDF